MTEPRFGAILTDPPWQFRVWNRDTGTGRSAESHYPTMPIEELYKINVASLALPDCALFMWACWPLLVEAIQLGEAWGFEFKTCAFLWSKTNRRAANRWTTVDDPANWFVGMGYWTRANSEPCLLFTRGKPSRKSKNVRQLIVSPIRRHSQKPDEQYRLIERLVDGPYLEMFARQPWPNWACWGNEVQSDVTVEASNA